MDSKYESLWKYVASKHADFLSLTFDEIACIAGVGVDHSFLKYKKELEVYGYRVGKISLKNKTITFLSTEQKGTLVCYVHGKGSSASEAKFYVDLFKNCDVVGFDYKSDTPWEAVEEFPIIFGKLAAGYDRVYLIANSIGAYFAMCSLPQEKLKTAYFISPVVDMKELIGGMMDMAHVSESDLRERKTIEIPNGETLSWEYFCYVSEHKPCWTVPTYILRGEYDNLVKMDTINTFAREHGAKVTVMPDGEHWFHTQNQMTFLKQWLLNSQVKD